MSEFRSTLPHGERLRLELLYEYLTGFDPRSRTGSDLLMYGVNIGIICFDPRSRTGSDV